MARIDTDSDSAAESCSQVQCRTSVAASKTADQLDAVSIATDSCSESSGHEHVIAKQGSLPATSGVFDYVRFVVQDVLQEQERHSLLSKSPVSGGSMCTGMGTEDLAFEGIRRALDDQWQFARVYQCENDRKCRRFLESRAGRTLVYDSNVSIASKMTVTSDGQHVRRPVSQVLTCGIVCVDLSTLSSTRRTLTDPSGKSSQSWCEMRAALEAIPFDERPKLIALECVQGMCQQRSVDVQSNVSSSSKTVSDALEQLGYVGEWQPRTQPWKFYLPQSRSRAYGLFLKVTTLSDQARHLRRKDVNHAMELLLRMQLPTTESLQVILQRSQVPLTPKGRGRGVGKEEAKMQGRKWPGQHERAASKIGLTLEEACPPLNFVEQVGPLLGPREIESLWIKLAAMSKKGAGNWSHGLLVCPARFTVRFGTLSVGKFPCVTPGMRYLILEDGIARLASCFDLLAVQGIQSKEVSFMRLGSADHNLLYRFAGNAFAANVVAAFLIAGLVVM